MNTSDGHTILAPSDIYSENVMIYKGISLIGMNRDSTIIEGIGSAPSVIHVLDTSFVTITGFTLRNGTVGVYVESSSHTTIPYNKGCLWASSVSLCFHVSPFQGLTSTRTLVSL